MRKISALAFALFASFVCAANAQVTYVKSATGRWLQSSDITIYVRNAGTDSPQCGSSIGSACKSIEGALAMIPTGFVPIIHVNLGAEVYDWPSVTFGSVPAFKVSAGTTTEGKVLIEGDCSAPLITFTNSGTGTVVNSGGVNKATQVTYNLGAWVGTVSEGTHFVRFPSSSGATNYLAVLSSTSPNLAVVRNLTTAFLTTAGTGYVCPFSSTIAVPAAGRFTGAATTLDATNVSFEGVKFVSAVSPTVVFPTPKNIRLNGTSTSSEVSFQTFTDNDSVASHYGNNTQMIVDSSRVYKVARFISSVTSGCVKVQGHIVSFGGVIRGAGTCNGGHMLSLSSSFTDATPPPYISSSIATMTATDFEGTGSCIRMSGSSIRVGTSSTNLTCVTSSGAFINAANNSIFGMHPTGTLSGTVTSPSTVLYGSLITGGITYNISNTSSPNNDFTVGYRTNVAVSNLPVADAVSGSAIMIGTATPTATATRFGTTSQCASATGACGTSTSGFFTVAAGSTTRAVTATSVGANSNVIVVDNSTVGALLGVTCNTSEFFRHKVTSQTGGGGFTLTLDAAPSTDPYCAGYFIVGQ